MSEYLCENCGLPITDNWCIWRNGRKIRHEPVEDCFPLVRAELAKLRHSLDLESHAHGLTADQLTQAQEAARHLFDGLEDQPVDSKFIKQCLERWPWLEKKP